VGHYKLDPEHGCGKKESEKYVITFQYAIFECKSTFNALDGPHDSEENEAAD
jgi:hypothetical protein